MAALMTRVSSGFGDVISIARFSSLWKVAYKDSKLQVSAELRLLSMSFIFFGYVGNGIPESK